MLTTGAVAEAADIAAIDWNARYTYAELEAQLKAINAAYPQITSLYPIGRSWQERTLWCMEITGPQAAAEGKTASQCLANIHGGERESATCAMYFAWWVTQNSQTEQVQDILSNYILYVIPVINPGRL